MTHIKPLRGIRILDFTQLLAGPSAAMLLGDLGAEVVKVESHSGDLSRSLGARNEDVSPIFLAYNRNKRSIALDFKSAAGKQIVQELVSRSDVVIEGFRPGVFERHGLGYEDLLKIQPKLVYASLSGFGADRGESRAGVDAIVQAASGMMAINGEVDGPPVKIGFQLVDAAAGMMLSYGILAALMQRNLTGEPQRLATTLYDVAIFMQSPAFVQVSRTGADVPRAGNTAASAGYPTDLFITRDGCYIQLAAYFPEQWVLLCNALERPDLVGDPKFADNGSRVQNAAVLREILQNEMLKRTQREWMDRFTALGIIASEVRTHRDVMDTEPQNAGAFYPVEVGNDGVCGYMNVLPPIHPRGDEEVHLKAPPHLGQHTSEILGELGYGLAEINKLKALGVASGS
jgi:crotonobetainyl-CoA:carnitine CoA-transferase CaiB-like acyl-CoA transferase